MARSRIEVSCSSSCTANSSSNFCNIRNHSLDFVIENCIFILQFSMYIYIFPLKMKYIEHVWNTYIASWLFNRPKKLTNIFLDLKFFYILQFKCKTLMYLYTKVIWWYVQHIFLLKNLLFFDNAIFFDWFESIEYVFKLTFPRALCYPCGDFFLFLIISFFNTKWGTSDRTYTIRNFTQSAQTDNVNFYDLEWIYEGENVYE